MPRLRSPSRRCGWPRLQTHRAAHGHLVVVDGLRAPVDGWGCQRSSGGVRPLTRRTGRHTPPTTMLSLAAVLAEPARRTPNKLAVVQGDLRLGYGELWRQARQHASALSARGVRPGDRVALLTPNVADFVRACYGILAVGAVVVPVPTLLSADEAAYIVRHSGAQTLLYDATFAGARTRSVTALGCVGSTPPPHPCPRHSGCSACRASPRTGPPGDRAPEARRDGRRRSRDRTGRLRRRPDRQDQGRPRRRHRGRSGQVPGADRGLRLRRRRRPPFFDVRRRPGSRGARRGRRVLRERRRARRR